MSHLLTEFVIKYVRNMIITKIIKFSGDDFKWNIVVDL